MKLSCSKLKLLISILKLQEGYGSFNKDIDMSIEINLQSSKKTGASQRSRRSGVQQAEFGTSLRSWVLANGAARNCLE